MRNQKGITLVALVITIIVLLILAGVSISLALGQNGVLTRASQAVQSNEKAKVLEELNLTVNEAQTAYYQDKLTEPSVKKNMPYFTKTENDTTTTTIASTTDPDVFKKNCTGASEVVIESNKGTASDEDTISGHYKSGTSQLYYLFTIDVASGDITLNDPVESLPSD